MYIVQIIDHNPSKIHLFYRDIRVAGLLFSACLLGEEPATLLLRQPCLGRVALPPVGWMGSVKTGFLRLLFSGGFPWRDHFQPSASEQRLQSVLQ